MSFFHREKTSLRDKSSHHTYDYDQRYHEMLNHSNGHFTFGGDSGFTLSPYEMFRRNVARYCESFMCSSFDQDEFLSSEQKSLRALRMAEPGFDGRQGEGDAFPNPAHRIKDGFLGKWRNEDTQDSEKSKNCYCTSNIICERCRARPSKSDTNIFSVLSVSFEPPEDFTPKKQSLLKKLTHFMNADYNAHKEKVAVSKTLPMKQRYETTKWNACECHVHIGRHSNCCQCQEPYHRTSCECVQHNGSHSYCCRCDPHLLQEYDQHLKKKRYLRLISDEEESSLVSSLGQKDARALRTPESSERADSTGSEDFRSGEKIFLKNYSIPPHPTIQASGRQLYTRERPCNGKEDEDCEPDTNHHPCESCCKKLDSIYGTALREVHNMLMEVSRTLLPSSHCCSVGTGIQNVSHLRPPLCKDKTRDVEAVESYGAELEWTNDESGTSEVGVQVTL